MCDRVDSVDGPALTKHECMNNKIQKTTMGGLVSRDKLAGLRWPTTRTAPVHTVVANEWLSLSGVPVTQEHLLSLYHDLNVRTIVTLTLTPLRGVHVHETDKDRWLLLNCAEKENEEWAVRDDNMLDGLPEDLRFLHVPVPDSCPFLTQGQLAALLREADQSKERGHRLHVHCWKGQGRAIIAAVMLAAVMDKRVHTTMSEAVKKYIKGVMVSDRLYVHVHQNLPGSVTISQWLQHGYSLEIQARIQSCATSELQSSLAHQLKLSSEGANPTALALADMASQALDNLPTYGELSAEDRDFLLSRAYPDHEEKHVDDDDDDDEDDDEPYTPMWVPAGTRISTTQIPAQ
jgi:hypothetical protein